MRLGPLAAASAPAGAHPRDAVGATQSVQVVAAFVDATRFLPDEAAARLAGVRAETIRKWRRRLPRWIRARTARCLEAHLAGQPVAARPGQSLQRAFEPVLRRRAPAE